MADRINAHMAKSRQSDSLGGPRIQRELEDRLAAIVVDACFDFGCGIAGGQTLKKGADINVTNIMTESPGGVQQGGVGQVTQSVSTQLPDTLIKTLDEIMGTSEFKALEPNKQDELRDMAETVRDEVSKSSPDEGKIARWSKRICSKLKEFGLAASASAIGSILATKAGF